jgi:hypothetical protein
MEDPVNSLLRFPLTDKHQGVFEKSSLETFKQSPYLPNNNNNNNNYNNNNNNNNIYGNQISLSMTHPTNYHPHQPAPLSNTYPVNTHYPSSLPLTTIPSSISIEPGNHFFELGEQPYETQRKCYSRENR